ncbi:hypothetical protein [Deinococcus humi]|uniref:Uncharacterized protein n=1 Tax=Deinococcus humi TaxID=662880 RepID=A0A7W8NE74_9DEIO|nr:hypothetical protein [Deinococcus humi]MBB5363061.1 hypothetical protein [Deinococcus humi]GGO24905.1 hypothetical protein GCM10008949_14240 [Deinococcus humi]
MLITLTLATIALGGMLLQGVVKTEAISYPAWQNGDVLSRQRSEVDHVHACDYRPGELLALADDLRRIVREGTGTGEVVDKALAKKLSEAQLLEELADRRYIERRLEVERLNHARNTKTVRAVYRVAGVAA